MLAALATSDVVRTGNHEQSSRRVRDAGLRGSAALGHDARLVSAHAFGPVPGQPPCRPKRATPMNRDRLQPGPPSPGSASARAPQTAASAC